MKGLTSMCLAIYKPAKKIISKELLAQAYKDNPHGAGYMYVSDNKVQVKKGFFNFDRFYKSYKKHEHKLCVIHFRIATSGQNDKVNCHPHKVSLGMYFVHNGILSEYTQEKSNQSDTIHFSIECLRQLPDDFCSNRIILNLLEEHIGYNKLIILDNKENVTIVNEDLGLWKNGVWYSNDGLFVPKLYKHYDYDYNTVSEGKEYIEYCFYCGEELLDSDTLLCDDDFPACCDACYTIGNEVYKDSDYFDSHDYE
jgi:hypothetical protein